MYGESHYKNKRRVVLSENKAPFVTIPNVASPSSRTLYRISSSDIICLCSSTVMSNGMTYGEQTQNTCHWLILCVWLATDSSGILHYKPSNKPRLALSHCYKCALLCLLMRINQQPLHRSLSKHGTRRSKLRGGQDFFLHITVKVINGMDGHPVHVMEHTPNPARDVMQSLYIYPHIHVHILKRTGTPMQLLVEKCWPHLSVQSDFIKVFDMEKRKCKQFCTHQHQNMILRSSTLNAGF